MQTTALLLVFARVLAWYLRVSPVHAGKPALLRFCRRVLLPRLPPFQARMRLVDHPHVELIIA